MEPVFIYDTTLRDGTQGENISFTVEEKIRIARKLDDLGIHYIEGGWPGSNPRDMQFFELAKSETFKTAKLAAFSSTRRPGKTCEQDGFIQALLESGAPCTTIFGKTWDLHVVEVMNNTLEENLNMIAESVAYLKQNGVEVIYDAEHFFDGYKGNRDYAIKTLLAAAKGGADVIVLCDTNGGSLPYEIETILNDVKDKVHEGLPERDTPVKLGIHTHNDSNLAVANSIIAVKNGAVMVQGTINGYGERCGNADLTSIIPILCLKMGCQCLSPEDLARLQKVSRYVSEMANMTPLNSRPFVGKSAFAHKGGIHVSAIMKNPLAYEHIDPELVGNKRRVLVSDLAGKSNVAFKAKELGLEMGEKGGLNGFETGEIVSEIKRLEQEGYQFEAAEGSLKILIQKVTEQFEPFFELEAFRVTIEKDKDHPCKSHAMIKIDVAGEKEITAAEGSGPLNALDNALRKALGKFFPGLEHMHLVDFKVRVIDGRDGTSAKVRVLIDSRTEETLWTTIGVSEDIIEACWQALADSFHYELSGKEKTNE